MYQNNDRDIWYQNWLFWAKLASGAWSTPIRFIFCRSEVKADPSPSIEAQVLWQVARHAMTSQIATFLAKFASGGNNRVS